MLRSLTCCCGRGDNRMPVRTTDQDGEDVDYLLGGGELEWNSSSRRFTKTSSRYQTSYVPPAIPSATTLPTIEDFRLLKTVGKGAFGKVTLAVHSSTRTLYALKAVPKSKITTQKQIGQIITEIQILRKVRHPFCVALQNDNFLFYVFEFASGGMLFHHLREEGRFGEVRARFYFGEIILALEYLHEFGIIFRDLKPENCMLSALGHIVLTDFGSAKMLDEGETSTTLAGTPQYIAPEVLRGEPYSYGADWWSCGILLYEMLVGKPPFNSSDRVELYRSVLRGEFKVPYFILPRAQSLLFRLIQKDPDLRLGGGGGDTSQSSYEIKEHPFFSKMPMDSDEAAQYSAEFSERMRHQHALERDTKSRRSRTSAEALSSNAESIIRSLSISTATAANRLSGLTSSLRTTTCNWTWTELERRDVEPPFVPRLRNPTDCSYFDPVMTSLPATLSDLVTTDRHLHIDEFKYIAPPLDLTDDADTPNHTASETT